MGINFIGALNASSDSINELDLNNIILDPFGGNQSLYQLGNTLNRLLTNDIALGNLSVSSDDLDVAQKVYSTQWQMVSQVLEQNMTQCMSCTSIRYCLSITTKLIHRVLLNSPQWNLLVRCLDRLLDGNAR